MGVTQTTLHNHIVYVDTDYPHRWVGVVGPKATVFEFDCITYAADMFTVTAVNSSTIAQVAGAFGGNAIMTTDTAEDDGVQVQLLGEAFYLSGQYPAYFGARFKVNDADQVDIALGLGITDTTFLPTSDGAYFRSVDESAVLNFVLEQDSAETTNAVATLVDDTWVVAEFYYDGVSSIKAYVDGVLKATVALTDDNFPDDEYLTPTIALLTGDTSANTLTLDWARAYQIRE